MVSEGGWDGRSRKFPKDALVANRPLDEMVRRRAERVAADRIAGVEHRKRLENRVVSRKELQAEREHLAAELLRGNLRRLWDEPA